MSNRQGVINPGNNAPRRGSTRSESKTFEQMLVDIQERLLLSDVSWEELRRQVWTGDRYRLRFFRDRLIAHRAVSLYKVGANHWLTAGDQLYKVTVPEMRLPNSPLVLPSRQVDGKFQIECSGCNVLCRRLFDNPREAKQWYWSTHVREAVGHR